MNNERIYQVLQGPVFSEKAQVLGDTAGVQVFKVDIFKHLNTSSIT